MSAVALLGARALAEARERRYVSLAPSTTEILFALGVDDELAGVSLLCEHPPAARTKPKVGSFSRPDVEKILSLRPDIVFCTGTEQAAAAANLKKLGLTVYVSNPTSFQELFDSIQGIGRRIDRQRQADTLIAAMRGEINRVTAEVEQVPPDKRPKVFVEFWHTPLMTAGKGSFVDELIHLAGGINIAGDLGAPYGNISAEEVIRRNPDFIFLTSMDGKNNVRLVKESWGWDKISAIVNDRVYGDIDPDLVLTPGPRLVDGLRELHRRLYP